MNKSIISGILLLSFSCFSAWAVPAKRGVMTTITQPDGTVLKVQLHGDEHFHYYSNEAGLPLLPDASGYFKAVSSEKLAEVRAEKVAARLGAIERSRREASRADASDASDVNTSKGIGLYNQLSPHAGEQNPLIILAEFADVKFSVENPHDYFNRFLNEEGFSDYGATGSCRDYFIDQSLGQYQPTFDLFGPITLENVRSYYGKDIWGEGNDANPEKMVIECCKAIDDEVDFKKYDTDGDGYVDNVYIIYAGEGQASSGIAETIWPHQSTLSSMGQRLTLDGVKIDCYGCCNEWEDGSPDGIGTFCHEFGHVLGLPDLYSYSSARSDYIATPGEWDIMDYGSYNNEGRTPPGYSVFERNAMGWIDLKVLNKNEEVALEDIQTTNQGCVVLTDYKNEFFLFENRQKSGWDAYIPGHGMLIWHINFNSYVWDNNSVNDFASRQYVDIEEANNKRNCYDNYTMQGYPFPGNTGNTEFSSTTTPNMLTWNLKSPGIRVYDIAENDGLITFSVQLEGSGISDINVSDTEGFGELFNLQGVKVAGLPAPGIYIKRSTDGASKVIIR